jgi:hypothetical protein
VLRGAGRLALLQGVFVLFGRDDALVSRHDEQHLVAVGDGMKEQLDVLDGLDQGEKQVAFCVVHAFAPYSR